MRGCDVFLAVALDSSLSPLELRDVLTAAGVRPAGKLVDLEVSAGAAVFVWLSSALARRQPVGATERRLILNELTEAVLAAGDAVAAAFGENGGVVPGYALTIVDGTFVGFTGETRGWLDLRTGEWEVALPRPPVESYSVSLTGLYAEMSALYRRRNGGSGGG